MNGVLVGVVAALLVLAVLTRAWALRRRRAERRRAAVTRTDNTGRVEVRPNTGDAPSRPAFGDPYDTMPIPVIPPPPSTVRHPTDPRRT